jgi:hypothetical protein
MRPDMVGFRIWLFTIWVLLALVTFLASINLGFSGMMIVLTDFSDWWRVQIYSDFLLHASILVCWILYREPSIKVGVFCSVCVLAFGGLFTFLYLFITTYRAKGDAVMLLTGRSVP